MVVSSLGQEVAESGKEKGGKKEGVELGSFELMLQQADGSPIAGATVRCYAMRFKEDPGSHYGWSEGLLGPMKSIASDEKGIAKIPYPIRLGKEPDLRTISQISMTIEHPEFVASQIDVDPELKTSVQALKPGCELSLSAQDANGELTLNFGILMAGPGAPAKWLVTDEPGKRSRSIPDGIWQTMLVSPQKDGRTRFSGILPLRLRASQSTQVRRLPMTAGKEIKGSLSENVKRPVKEGKVFAHCIPKPMGNTWDDKEPSISWGDVAEVQPDGTFYFPSLPKTGKIQLIAICRGYVIQCEERTKTGAFTSGLVTDMESIDEAELILGMEETGDLAVRVSKPDGEPLEGAGVYTWPNQRLELGGSMILGEFYRTIDQIEMQLNGKIPPRESSNRYSGKTDKNGIAILRDIPIKIRSAFTIEHTEYLLPKDAAGVRREIPFILTKTGVTEIPVIVEKVQP